MNEPSPLTSLIPMLIISIPIIILNISIAKRKGKEKILFGILGAIPIANFISMLYLISLTDKEILEKLDEIINHLNKK